MNPLIEEYFDESDLPCVLEHLALTMRDALSAAGDSDAG